MSELLVTTSHSLLRVDTRSGEARPVHRGLGLYFGLATDGERWYVAARGRMVSSEVPPAEERGRVLVLGRGLEVEREIHAPFPLRDMHQILLHRGRLWLTCSFDNQLAIHDLASGAWEAWQPLGRPAEPPYDVNHFNSLAVIDGDLWVLAHNRDRPPSELLRFDLATRALLSRTPFGRQSHDIVPCGGHILGCSSAAGELIRTDGWRLPTGGFPRGIATLGAETFVGISEIAERRERDLGAGAIAVYDEQWRRIRDIPLPGEGLVLEIRPREAAP